MSEKVEMRQHSETGSYESTLLDTVITAVKDIRNEHPDSGDALRKMILGIQTWKTRSRTKMRVISRNTAEYKVILDLVLPEIAEQLAFTSLTAPLGLGGDQVLIPLSFLKKGPIPLLKVCEPDDLEVPHLPREENSVLATLFLVELTDHSDSDSTPQPPDNFQEIIRRCAQIVLSDPPDDLSENEFLEIEAARRLVQTDDGQAQERFEFFAKLLQTHFVLFAALDVKGPIRRLVTFSYVDEFNFTKRVQGNLLSRFVRRLWTLGAYSFDNIPVGGAGEARSVHVEIALPGSVQAQGTEIKPLRSNEPSGKKSIRDNVVHISWRGGPTVSEYSASFTAVLTNYLGTSATAAISVFLLMLTAVFIFIVTRGAATEYSNEIFSVVPTLLVIPSSLGLFTRNDDEDHMLDAVQRPLRIFGYVTVTLQMVFAISVLVVSKRVEHYAAPIVLCISVLMLIPLVRSLWKSYSALKP